MDEDDNDLTGADAWSAFTPFFNADEFLDLLAQAGHSNADAYAAYELLRAATDYQIPPIASRQFVINARARP
jgi:hypothetical protein